jgi:hypothetical protein
VIVSQKKGISDLLFSDKKPPLRLYGTQSNTDEQTMIQCMYAWISRCMSKRVVCCVRDDNFWETWVCECQRCCPARIAGSDVATSANPSPHSPGGWVSKIILPGFSSTDPTADAVQFTASISAPTVSRNARGNLRCVTRLHTNSLRGVNRPLRPR